MCTVTFVPVNDKVFITSNRDERSSRKIAVSPSVCYHKGSKLIFPKDADAGGSWIALNANGNAAVLLNGAFEKHERRNNYIRSRGLVLIDVIAEAKPVRFLVKAVLTFIEPFTMIIWENNCLYEFRWDGTVKHCVQLRNNRHHMWSSATLYDKEAVKKREYWFARFLNRTPVPGEESILHFHTTAGDGNAENDLRMTRHGLYATVSVTLISLSDVSGSMVYLDCQCETQHQCDIALVSSYVVSQPFLHENN
jgi:hypothetical protein